MADIKHIKIGGVSYDIVATSADYVPASGIVGQISQDAISAVPWSAASGLSATLTATSTTGFALAKDVAEQIETKIGGVYKVKGSLTAVVTGGAITNMPTDAVNGDVYNIALPEGTTSATLDGQTILNGDNVVFVKQGETAGAWDKLAATVDLSTYASTAWTTGYILTATSAAATGLWNDVTTEYADTKTAVATSSTYWNSAYDAVSGAVTASGDMTATDNTGKLAQVGAITAYVDDKITETVAETIDIASEITTTTQTSAIPNVGAVTGYVQSQLTGTDGYVKKSAITYSNDTLEFDF